MAVEKEKYNTGTHDLGFMLYYSFGNGYRAWQKKHKPYLLETGSKDKNVKVAAFLRVTNEFESYEIEGTMNCELLIKIMEDFASKIKQISYVWLDNAPSHRSKKFKEKIPKWESKGLYIKYLPTYSPELNIIKILWRKSKYQWLAHHLYQNFIDFEKAVRNMLAEIGSKWKIDFQFYKWYYD